MYQLDGGIADACSGGDGKYLFEMQGLSGIDKVEHSVGFEVADPAA
jgi:hypothetical protein